MTYICACLACTKPWVLSSALHKLSGHSGIMCIILAGRKWRQKDQGFEVLFEASLGRYISPELA